MNIIDFIIVFYIIYQIVAWGASTKAKTLLKGLLPIILLYFTGKLLQLNTVSWLLESFTPILTLAVIIIFQPELRKFLENLGSTSVILGQFKPKAGEKTHLIKNLSKSIELIQKEKLGALIVIEQGVPLDPYIETGVQIEANISAELIGSIFWKNNPTHDGAIIIREDKITAVGCLLPLSSATEKRKGTRHLAALGLSEVSDAITIIVSEETGRITIARNNTLSDKLNRKELEEVLFSIFKKD